MERSDTGLSVLLSQNSADIPLTPAQSVIRYPQTGTQTPQETVDMTTKTIRKPKPKSPEAQRVAEELAAKTTPVVEEPKAKPKRSFRVVWSQGTEGTFFVLRITSGSSSDYLTRALQPNVYLLTKLEDGRETTYTVVMGQANSYTCTCEAGKHGRSCKHGDCLIAIRERQSV